MASACTATRDPSTPPLHGIWNCNYYSTGRRSLQHRACPSWGGGVHTCMTQSQPMHPSPAWVGRATLGLVAAATIQCAQTPSWPRGRQRTVGTQAPADRAAPAASTPRVEPTRRRPRPPPRHCPTSWEDPAEQAVQRRPRLWARRPPAPRQRQHTGSERHTATVTDTDKGNQRSTDAASLDYCRHPSHTTVAIAHPAAGHK